MVLDDKQGVVNIWYDMIWYDDREAGSDPAAIIMRDLFSSPLCSYVLVNLVAVFAIQQIWENAIETVWPKKPTFLLFFLSFEPSFLIFAREHEELK